MRSNGVVATSISQGRAVSTESETGSAPGIRTVVASSVIGTVVEWFDFFAYSTAAAMVFNVLFFPQYDSVVGTILAFGGIAVGYFGRPLGSIFFGHFGDRIGRKAMLVVSLFTMGGATFLIGLMPTYATIGIAAPAILLTLRFLQGFALGGEWGGAVLLVVEHAPPRRRGFFASFPQVGLAIGLSLATLTYLALVQLPPAQFQSWGWRIPFLLSAILVFVGMVIRLKITETPQFEALRQRGGQVKLPFVETLRTHGGQVALCALTFGTIGGVFYALFTFSVTYGKDFIGQSTNLMLAVSTLCAAVSVIGLPIAGHLADRFGVRAVFCSGVVVTIVTAFPAFWLIDSGSTVWLTLGYLLITVGFCGSYGTLGLLYAQAFDVSVRYTGISLGIGLGTIIGSAFVPIIYLELLDTFGGSWAISAYLVLTGIVAVATSIGLTRRNGFGDDAEGSSEVDVVPCTRRLISRPGLSNSRPHR
ncbi:MAG: MFS transporter [Mycobacterium sp.]